MNLLHLKYMVTVAENESINKAAEKLLVAQPNLSRAIKELEADLNIVIFQRTNKGMTLTPAGEQLLVYAREILHQVETVERIYKVDAPKRQVFSISVPRASYIADAFVRLCQHIGPGEAEIFYKETNAQRAIRNILEANYNLGILRYAGKFDHYFKGLLNEKGLHHELVAEFHYVLIMHKDSPLAQKDVIHFEDLKPLIEIAHADPYVPSLSLSTVKGMELPDDMERRIFIFERGSQFELLATNLETFMWVSPVPKTVLQRYDLVQRDCPENRKIYRDVLIYRKNYALSELDKRFIKELKLSQQQHF